MSIEIHGNKAATIVVNKRVLFAMYELLGLVGGDSPLDSLYADIGRALNEPKGVNYLGWRTSQLKRLKLHAPSVNHMGVIVFLEPGGRGDHNKAHFPCTYVGVKKRT